MNRAARAVFKKSAERAIEEATGTEIPSPGEVILREARELFDTDDPTEGQLKEATRSAFERGRINRRQLEQLEETDMVDFRQFVSIYAEKCGGGADEAAAVWNRQKEQIQGMTTAEVRRELRCP